MTATTIAVIDYGMGNLHSVGSALAKVAPTARIDITSDVAKIRAADRVIFPGVGGIRDCMAEIRRLGFDELVPEIARSCPVLAICVGYQALFEHSEENGGIDCIGLYKGRVRYFGDALKDAGGQRLKVPHMGWNRVAQTLPHPLWDGIEDNARFYFVHSYYVQMQDRLRLAGSTSYGVDIDAAMAVPGLFGVQFHPEKSGADGLRLLQNFVVWDGDI